MPARSLRLATAVNPAAASSAPHRRGLLPAVLQQQPASRLQVRRRRSDDAPQVVQSVGAGHQGLARFVAQAGQVRVRFGHVGGLLTIRS